MNDLMKYTYIVLTRAMLNDEEKRRKYLQKIYNMESGSAELPWNFNSFVWKYGRDFRHLE
jgi:peptidoglycan/xylan/chitin deacetylase (PgdA/CDA1 family)